MQDFAAQVYAQGGIRFKTNPWMGLQRKTNVQNIKNKTYSMSNHMEEGKSSLSMSQPRSSAVVEGASASGVAKHNALSTMRLQSNTPSYREEMRASIGTAAVPALVHERVKYTTDLARLSTSNPILAFTLTVVMFSIAGIPPLAGFYSKAFLMFAAISSANYVLAIIGVAMSVVSAFYYLRIVKIMYFESLKSPGQRNQISSAGSMLSFMQINKEISLVCAGTLSFLLFFSLHPKPVFLITQKAALLVS